MRLRKRMLGFVLVVFLLPVVPGGIRPAEATGLVTIYGTVTDPVGRPLQSARVTNLVTGKAALTAADGSYTMEEDYIGDYRMRASRGGLNTSATKTVDAAGTLSPVDFTMTYVLSGQVSPTAFNNDPPETISISTTTYAPILDQCITFTDNASGGEVTLLLQSQSGEMSTWVGSYTVPAGRADGSYGWSVRSAACTSGVALTNVTGSNFRIDSIVPTIDRTSIVPFDRGHAVFSSQPLLVKMSDGGSGINASSILFTLTDESAGTTSTHGASFNGSTGWAKTSPVTLTRGHIYRISVFARDNAGNSNEVEQSPEDVGGGFLATSFGIAGQSAWIPVTDCRIEESSSLTTNNAVCENVPLRFAAVSLEISGTRHGPDAGYLDQTASLASAQLREILLGQKKPAFASYATKSIQNRFDFDKSPLMQSVGVPGVTTTVGTVTVPVPKLWQNGNVVIEMDPVTPNASTGMCQDPSASSSSVFCVPDPALNRFTVQLKDSVSDPKAVALQHQAQYGFELRQIYWSPKAYAAWMPLSVATSLSWNGSVLRVLRFNPEEPMARIRESIALNAVGVGIATVEAVKPKTNEYEISVNEFTVRLKTLMRGTLPERFSLILPALTNVDDRVHLEVGNDYTLYLNPTDDPALYDYPPLVFAQSHGLLGFDPLPLPYDPFSRFHPDYTAEGHIDENDCAGTPPAPDDVSGYTSLGTTLSTFHWDYSISFDVPGQFVDNINAAIARWVAVGNSGFTATEQLRTANNNRAPDGQSVISWAPINPGTADDGGAIATCWSWTDCDIQFSPNTNWSDNLADGTFDVEHGALHEVGHVIGLGHVRIPAQVMCGVIGPANDQGGIRTLAIGEHAGLRNQHPSTTQGYYILGADGGIFTFGGQNSTSPNAAFYGSAAGFIGGNGQTKEAVDMVLHPSRCGYWILGIDGAVFSFGCANYYGGANAYGIAKAVAIQATASGLGYWILGSDGGVFSFGDANYYGNPIGVISGSAVDLKRTPSGNGYWILSSCGCIYSFGDAQYHGNAPADFPARSLAAVRDGSSGYWILTSDGGVHARGSATLPPAPWWAPPGGDPRSITSIPGTNGQYAIIKADGETNAFGMPFIGYSRIEKKHVAIEGTAR